MKANELRIGNWVLIPYQNAPIAIPAHETKVQGITIFGEILTDNTPEHEGLETHPNHISPIPLTEERLAKLGWKWSILHQAGHKDGFDLDINWVKEGVFSLSTWKKGHIICDNLRYVHQLQNLYFALTEKELTIE